MNIKDELLEEHSRRQTIKIANYISNDKRRFAELMQYFFSKDKILSSRAAWVMSFCAIKFPFLIDSYLKTPIKKHGR